MPNWCECHFEVENLLPSEKEVMEQQITNNTLFSYYIPEPDRSNTPDWHCGHWGTKWDINQGDIPLTPEEDRGTLQANFLTAWSPPQEGVRALSEMFPHATFYLSYVETGNDFLGVSLFKNGEMVEKDASPSDLRSEWMDKNHPNSYDEEEEDFSEEAIEAFWDVEWDVYETAFSELQEQASRALITA